MIQQGKGKQLYDMCAPRGGPLGLRLGCTKSLQTLWSFQADPGDSVPLTGEASPPEQHGEI